MTTNYLVCPIPAGYSSHYKYTDPKDPWGWFSDDSLPWWLKDRNRFEKKNFHQFKKEPACYGKIFKRRKTKDSKKVKPKPTQNRWHYVIRHPGKVMPLVVCCTKKEAFHALDVGSARWHSFYKKLFPAMKLQSTPVDIPLGSYVYRWKPTEKYFNENNDAMKFPLKTKRCAECPNTKSDRGLCGCSLFMSIRDSGSEHQHSWLSPHQARINKKKFVKNILNPKSIENPSIRLIDITIKI